MKKGWRVLLAMVGTLAICLTPAISAQFSSEKKAAARVQAGYLVVPASPSNQNDRLRIVPYYPQAGDLLLYDYANRLYSLAFQAIGSGPPIHSAIAFERPNGSPALLDITGPKVVTARVALLDVEPRLKSYKGTILIRRVRQSLTTEQSAALTEFALAQDDKAFAVGRLMLQGTPFRARTGLRRQLFGRTHFNRQRWICSELVVAAATVAGLLDPREHFANSLYPRDLAYDENCDLSAIFHDPVLWVPDANPVIQGDCVLTVLDR